MRFRILCIMYFLSKFVSKNADTTNSLYDFIMIFYVLRLNNKNILFYTLIHFLSQGNIYFICVGLM